MSGEENITESEVMAEVAESLVSEPAVAKPPFSLYDYFQTENGRRKAWYIGLLATTVATLSAGYAFWPNADTPILGIQPGQLRPMIKL